MEMSHFAKFVLRRSPFIGQLRIFHYLFRKGWLGKSIRYAKPLKGNFQIIANPERLIDARVIYTGDYEPEVKQVFSTYIRKSDVVLDVGANVGFHSLYLSELVGNTGKVYSFEPIRQNFDSLNEHLKLNNRDNVHALNIALGNKNEEIHVNVNVESKNPGAFNLFNREDANCIVTCKIGDEVVKELNIEHVDFIKIDVEGYEVPVLIGLRSTINKFKPVIVFEYDMDYQSKVGENDFDILKFLESNQYKLYSIHSSGIREFKLQGNLRSYNILALCKV